MSNFNPWYKMKRRWFKTLDERLAHDRQMKNAIKKVTEQYKGKVAKVSKKGEIIK